MVFPFPFQQFPLSVRKKYINLQIFLKVKNNNFIKPLLHKENQRLGASWQSGCDQHEGQGGQYR